VKTISVILHRLTARQIGITAVIAAVAALALAGALTRHNSTAGAVPRVTEPWSCCWNSASPPPPASAATSNTGPVAASTSTPVDTGDDGEAGPAPSPTGPAGGDVQAAQEATIEFLARYLNTQGQTPEQWRSSWNDQVTAQLAQLLADADMTRVPVGRVGQVKDATALGTGQVVVTVPVVANSDANTTITTLKVTVVQDGGRWLASQIDEVRP
jgi:hypothetical protein